MNTGTRRAVARASIVTIAAAGLLGLHPLAAEANSPALSIPNVATINPSGCTTVPYSYNADPPAGYSTVHVYIDADDSHYDHDVSASRDGATGSGSLTICSSTQDTYTASMSVDACTPSYSSCTDYDAPDITFQFGTPAPPPPPPPTPPASVPVTYKLTAAVTGKAKRDHIVLKAVSTLAGSDGSSKPNADGNIRFQTRIGHSWFTLGRKIADRTGRARLSADLSRPIRIRVLATGLGEPTAVSRVIRIR